MKYLIISLTTLFFLSCQQTKKSPTWRYKVEGYVNYKGESHEAIWYTDTLEISKDTIGYHNSDGSHVVIKPPYTIFDYKKNLIIEKY